MPMIVVVSVATRFLPEGTRTAFCAVSSLQDRRVAIDRCMAMAPPTHVTPAECMAILNRAKA